MPAILPAAAAAVAAAAPAVAAQAVAQAAVVAAIKSVAINALINLGVSAVMSALQPQVGTAGRTYEWTLDPDAPIPFAFGRVGVAGSVVHADTFGPDKMYYGFVSVLSGAGPVDEFETFRGDDEFVGFDDFGKAISSQWANEMWMKTRQGFQPDQALGIPIGLKNNSSLPGWTASNRLSGKACYMLVLGENSKRSAYPNGEPKPLWVIRGLRCYDPRLDSTYPGGLGSCRLSNPATWVYSQNPIIHALKWTLGLWEGPTGKGAPGVDYQVGGIGAKPEGIDFPSFVSAANIADANGWTCAAYPTTDDTKSQVLDAFLQAGGAVYAQKAGKIACIQRGAPRTSIVTISAADTAGPIEFDAAASRINRINAIRPRYWSEAHRWQLTALPEVTSASYIAQDNGRRPRGIDYPFVTNATQCGQLAALQIANTREGIAGTIPLKPHLQRITPGDAFTITEPGFVLDGLKCLCLSTDYDPATGIHNVTFVSETDAKYAFALGQSPIPPVAPTLTPANLTVTAPGVADWTIVPRVPTDTGIQLPIWDLVGSVTNDTAIAMIVEWGSAPATVDPEIPLADQIAWNEAYYGSPTATRIPIQGMQPGGTYYVAVRNVRGSNFSARTLYGPEVVPNLVAISDADSAALDRIAAIESDNLLAIGEKPDLLRIYQAIVAEQPGISAQGLALGATTQRTAYNDAFVAVGTYLASLTPAWDNLTVDTPISGPELRARLLAYYTAKEILRSASLAVVQTIAETAATNASTALGRIETIQSDSVLSRSEKPEIMRQWAAIENERTALRAQAIAAGTGTATALAAYDAAFTALASYLGGLTPQWDDTAVDTPIDPATFQSRFSTFYVAKQALLNAMLGVVGSDAQTALGRIDIIRSDSWLSRNEKPIIASQWQAIEAEYPQISAQALSVGATAARNALITARDALAGYLLSLSPAWNDTATDTPIVPATFAARFADYYTARAAAQAATLAAINEDAQAALTRLTAIDSDGILSRGEKPELMRLYAGIAGEYAGIIARALAVGANAERAAYITAFDALNTYLGGLTPAWDDTNSDTPIVGTTLTARFQALYIARQAVLNAMIGIVHTDAQSAIAQLALIASDSVLSKNEKPEVNRQWQSIAGEYPGLSARALAVGATAQRTALVNAYNALTGYLGGLSPQWNDFNSDTPIDGNFYVVFTNYYTAKQSVIDAMIGLLDTDTNTLLNELGNIQSDGILSRGEKPAVIEKWQVIANEYSPLVARLTAAGAAMDTVRTDYQNRYTELANYLGSLSPPWNDTTQNTPISATTLRDRFANYFVSKQAAINALTTLTGGAPTFYCRALPLASRVGTRTTPGSVTTATVQIGVYNFVTTPNPVTFTWEQIGGDSGWTITNPNGDITAFSNTVNTGGEIKRGTFVCTIINGDGRTVQVTVGGTVIYNI